MVKKAAQATKKPAKKPAPVPEREPRADLAGPSWEMFPDAIDRAMATLFKSLLRRALDGDARAALLLRDHLQGKQCSDREWLARLKEAMLEVFGDEDADE